MATKTSLTERSYPNSMTIATRQSIDRPPAAASLVVSAATWEGRRYARYMSEQLRFVPQPVSTDAPALLEGISVVDLSRYLPGPFATLQLSWLGADVTAVQRRGLGDPMRHFPPFANDGKSFASHALEKNKTIIEADFTTAQDRDTVRDACLASDVVIEGFRPGVLSRFGLDYKSLRAGNEQLIYCSISGFGQAGARAQTPGHDLTYQAIAGLLSDEVATRDSTPALPRLPYADLAGGLTAAMSICAALVRRERTGAGAYLDISITDAARALRAHTYPMTHTKGHTYTMAAPLNGDLACYDIYAASDRGLVAVAALEPHFFANLCAALELENLASLDSYTAASMQPLIRTTLADTFGSRPAKSWRFLEDKDCCVAIL